MVNTLFSNASGVGLILGQGTVIPHDFWPKNQNMKQKNTVANSIKTYKHSAHQKKIL